MKILSAAFVAAAFEARYPNPGGPIDISAAAEKGGKVPDVQAAAVRGFAQVSGKLVYVRALDHFFITAGEVVQAGDYVQVQETEARRLVAAGRAEIADDDEVAQAQAEAAKAKK